jgi:hypothetical protein
LPSATDGTEAAILSEERETSSLKRLIRAPRAHFFFDTTDGPDSYFKDKAVGAGMGLPAHLLRVAQALLAMTARAS